MANIHLEGEHGELASLLPVGTDRVTLINLSLDMETIDPPGI